MPSRRRRPGRRRATVLHPTRPRPRPARPAARPQRSRGPTASRKSGIPHEFRDYGRTATSSNTAPCPDVRRPCVSPASTPAIARTRTGSRIGGGRNAPPAPRPHRCPSSSLTTPCRSRRALPPSISNFWPGRGRSSTWRSCSSSTPATTRPEPDCENFAAAEPGPRQRPRMPSSRHSSWSKLRRLSDAPLRWTALWASTWARTPSAWP